VVITPLEFGSQKVFVGGEVKQPGVFEMPGEIDVLQAILLAGGWTEQGSPTQVIIMRRKPGGEMMTRVVDVRNGLARHALYDIGPLKRFDVRLCHAQRHRRPEPVREPVHPAGPADRLLAVLRRRALLAAFLLIPGKSDLRLGRGPSLPSVHGHHDGLN
jgi:hypothetical protein